MQIRLAPWARWLRPLAFAMLAGVLAACAGNRGAATAPASATTGAPAAATALATRTTAPAASPTAVLTSAPATTTRAPATAQPAGPTAGPTDAPATLASATPDPAVAAVLAYLDARAHADVTTVTKLSCKTWKTKAITEAVSFRSMNAKLVGVSCQVNGSAGTFTLVGCGGKMVTTYGTESRDWDLSAFVYQVAAEDGQWKMCGYH